MFKKSTNDATAPSGPVPASLPWRVLMVDDEPGVHEATAFVLSGFRYGGRPIELYSCYSRTDALKWLAENDAPAVAIVDVVMETSEAGLELVSEMRRLSKCGCTSIVLRTGQPGAVRDDTVAEDHEIDGYVKKSDATSEVLRRALTLALRGHQRLTDRIQQDALSVADRILAETTDAFFVFDLDWRVRSLSQGAMARLGLDNRPHDKEIDFFFDEESAETIRRTSTTLVDRAECVGQFSLHGSAGEVRTRMVTLTRIHTGDLENAVAVVLRFPTNEEGEATG